MKRSHKILIRLLGLVGIVLVIISNLISQEPAKSILKVVGLGMVAALLLQLFLANIKSDMFKERPGKPD